MIHCGEAVAVIPLIDHLGQVERLQKPRDLLYRRYQQLRELKNLHQAMERVVEATAATPRTPSSDMLNVLAEFCHHRYV